VHNYLYDTRNWAGQDPIGQANYFQDYPGTILYNGSAYYYSNGAIQP